MTRKKLPIGIQTFAIIREEGYYYVDKTRFILQLAQEGRVYFLSRPRRFGKSLLIDTIAELYAGSEPLFQGLYCHDKWNWQHKHPVIRISFTEGVRGGVAGLDQRVREILAQEQKRLGVSCVNQSIAGLFSELISEVHAAAGQRVVVLIDEYDKPILDSIARPDEAREIRDALRNLYSVLKGADAHIQFAMLTGVSKFSKVSLFSGLNNLRDITVNSDYSAICGYTDVDVDTVFAPELPGLDRSEVKRWYNGYNWTGDSVYNPFDLLLLFQEREFKPYWFETGTPTFLIDILTKAQIFTPDLGRTVAAEALLSSFDVGQISPEALLFQAGYLTIDSVWRIPGRQEFTLKYPNYEVQASLNDSLLQALSGNPMLPGPHIGKLYRLLQANDFTGMQALFTAFFESIPFEWYTHNPIAQYEGYYASVFYSYFASLGLDISTEQSSNAGRLDMAVRFNQNVYVFEFKVVELAPEGRALQQIKDKGYAKPYLASGEPVHMIGVEFSKASRSVVGFEVESLLNK